MSEKFTPGPWEVTGAEFTQRSVCYEIVMPNNVISKANADIIAAAPDLYAALKEVYDTFWGASKDDRIWTVDMQRFAQDALAKARGEA